MNQAIAGLQSKHRDKTDQSLTLGAVRLHYKYEYIFMICSMYIHNIICSMPPALAEPFSLSPLTTVRRARQLSNICRGRNKLWRWCVSAVCTVEQYETRRLNLAAGGATNCSSGVQV